MTAPRDLESLAFVTALERARTVVAAWEDELRRELPENAYLFDVHTHLGNDIDGMVGSYDELSSVLDRFGFKGAFMFCLDEHDREPAFTVPNDRTLAHAERSRGRLVPFVRLDLTAQPLDEARRCLDLGARGIKLHPRAQAFALSDERLQPIFALAVERDVPILIHGGRGLPPIAEDLEALVRRNEGVRLIVAHAGIADMAGPRRPARRYSRRVLRHVGLERPRSPRPLPPGRARAGAVRIRLSLRSAAELAARGRSDGEARRLRRQAAAAHARRHRPADAGGRRARAAVRPEGADVARPAA